MSHIERGGPVTRLVAARRYGETRWLTPSVDELCRRTQCLTAPEIGLLDPKDTAYIISIREQVFVRGYGPLKDVIGGLPHVVHNNPLPT
jgi:hypothetical protein